MKKFVYQVLGLLIIVSLIACLLGAEVNSAVTYEFSGGRLGDTLVTCLHAIWTSYRTGIPLLYKSFQYSEQLKLHNLELHYSAKSVKQFKQVKHIVVPDDYKQIRKDSNTLYVISYFAESEISKRKDNHPFEIDWTDQAFIDLVRTYICPREQIPLILIPDNCISIALHVRKGGGFDPIFSEHDRLLKGQKKKDYADIGAPEKFACDEFFISQLDRVLTLVGNCPVYVFIFTDDMHPEKLAQRYAKALKNPGNITFDYRKSTNTWKTNVLTDFFSMMKFDCIIRPDSHFSIIASRLGYQLATLAATILHWDKNKLIIDKVDTDVSPLFFEKVNRLKASLNVAG